MTFEDFIKSYGLENGGCIGTTRFSLKRKVDKTCFDAEGPCPVNFTVKKEGNGYTFVTQYICQKENRIELFEKDCIAINYKKDLSLFFLSCNEAGDIELNILSDIVNPKQNK